MGDQAAVDVVAQHMRRPDGEHVLGREVFIRGLRVRPQLAPPGGKRDGENRSPSAVLRASRTSKARQPATTGESSKTTQRTRSGRCLATITLSMPPSEWPTRITGAL